jgi:nucleoside-diphosphate-sugar epimerase
VANVLISGGAGYVGGWLTDRAIEAGHDVRVYDLLLYEDRYLKDVPFVAGDVLDYDRLRPHLDWADTVVWLAGLVGDPACALDPSLTDKVNLESVRELCRTFDGRIIFPSTCSVYGAQDDELDEESPTQPLSLYAESKLAAERLLVAERPDSLILRLATLAGLGDTYSRIRLDLVVNLLVVRARLTGELPVFGGRQYRPLLHVRDVGTAVVPHLDSDARGIYNLGVTNVTILELAHRVAELVGNAKILTMDVPFQDTRNYRVSFERAQRELGFVARYTVDDAIEEIAHLIDDGRVKDLSLSQFSNLEALRPYLKPEAIPFGREVRNAHALARHATPTETAVAR